MRGKAHDSMFRKAQMKLFSMIVSILLAIFIALIGSINVITKAVMNQQSKDVLREISSDFEYDEKEQIFKYIKPMADTKENKNGSSSKPSQAVTTKAAATTGEITTSTAALTSDAATESATDPQTEGEEPDVQEESAEPENQYVPEDDTTEPPQQNTEAQTDAEMSPEEWWKKYGQGGGITYDPSSPYNPFSIYNPANPYNKFNPASPYYDPNAAGASGGWGGDQNSGKDDKTDDKNQYYNNYGWGWTMPKSYDSENTTQNNYYYDYSNAYSNPYYNPYYNYNFNYNKKSASGDTETAQGQSYSGEGSIEQTVYTGEEVLSGFTVLGNSPETVEARQLADAAKDNDSDQASVSASYSYEASNVSAQKAEAIPKAFGSIDYFVIMADRNGEYLASFNNDEIKAEKAQLYVTAILNNNDETGMINSYQYYQADKSNGTMMVLTDKSYEMDMLKQLKRTTIIIGSIALIILSVLAYFLSKKSIQPIKVAFNKQKQFVSDASHELKTPLTVISTNADVLEGEIGENKWLSYIKVQTERMSVLVNDLLNLTRMENNSNDLICADFDLSKAITNTALPFECQAFESNKTFEVDVEEGITINGSEKHIKQMAAIFIDNALKYSNAGGTIRVSLKRIGDKKVLSVFNTGSGIRESDKEKIFERFYRSDVSRNRATGGYGLGLAIAKSIIDRHKFKVNVLNQPGKSICFMVTM